MPRSIVGISLDDRIIDVVDRKRGLVPRSRFIEQGLEKFLKELEN